MQCRNIFIKHLINLRKSDNTIVFENDLKIKSKSYKFIYLIHNNTYDMIKGG